MDPEYPNSDQVRYGSRTADSGLKGEAHQEGRAATAQKVDAPVELPSEGRHELKTETPRFFEFEVRRQTDAVVFHAEAHFPFARRQRNLDDSLAPIGECMLQRVRNELIDEQAAGDGLVHREGNWLHLNRQLHDARGNACRLEDVARNGPDVVGELNTAVVLRLIELLVNQRNREHAITAFFERASRSLAVHFAELHVEQACDHLEIVLDAVVHFLEQDLLLFERRLERGLPLLVSSDVAGHLRSGSHNPFLVSHRRGRYRGLMSRPSFVRRKTSKP